ncbi:MAG TPA: metallopeptidase TldD-related protein [Phycisphaerae bacterium]|nr:metallopeptidase TldD-related protein [Phycisphaerae bacterium]
MIQRKSGRLQRYRGGLLAALLLATGFAPVARAADPHPLLGLLADELQREMQGLETPDGTKPYFLQYTVTDESRCNVSAELGALADEQSGRQRALDVDLRCGDYALDNTRQIRGRGFSGGFDDGNNAANLPLNGDPVATRQAIWLVTDQTFKDAVKRLAQVKANLSVKVEEEDQSADFSKEKPSDDIEPWLDQPVDTAPWVARIKKLSERFRAYPDIYDSRVTLTGRVTNTLLVNTEGSKLQYGRGWWRIGIQASTIADDGMELWQYKAFDAHTPDGLPDDATIAKAVDEVIKDVRALRAAPIVEPYTGPAILRNRATGVFFHEIFGHRIEGHRQKDVEEGQTFAKKLGQEVLPKFLTVVDDPSKKVFDGIELNGYYTYDDEAVPAQPVTLVDDGTLETFLMSRSPTRGVEHSNGHGRRQPGARVVARQGNLIVESDRQMPFDELRAKLLEECRKQNKDYGLLFEDISGGFTTTRRYGPQAFKVLPIIVYKVFVDGRPDELVRGVDIVGTPLTCFSRILATGNDPDVFNGVCGAESGSVPVSAIAPSILVEQIEVEKKQKAQDRPPILPAPIALEKTSDPS